MLHLARTGTTATDDSSATGIRATPGTGAADGAQVQSQIPARYYHSAIHDPVRDRMVVFGGYSGSYVIHNDVWALSLTDTPTWTQLVPSGTPPHARYAQSAIYDPVRERMVVFGGWSGSSYLNDVWALSLASTPAWTQLTPAGTPPSARYAHSAIHDPARDRMVVFGGGQWVSEGSYLGHNDVWTLSLEGAPTWTELTPSGTPPGGRVDHGAIYDPLRDRMVVFGGASDSYFSDVWALSLTDTTWTQVIPSGTTPDARYLHSAVYDPTRDCMVVFGGYDGSAHNDVWTLSLGDTAWTQPILPGTLPSARFGHSAIYDPAHDRMVVFGGYGGSARNDVWALPMAGTLAWTELLPSDTPALYPQSWTQLTPAGAPPGKRYQHSATYDPSRGRMVVFGGHYYDGSPHSLNEIWTLSLAGSPAWTQLTPSGTPPSPRGAHSAIYDPVRDRLVVFGGYDYAGSPNSLNDVWALSLADTPAWTELTPSGTPPSTRYAHSAIYDPVRDRMVVFGGYSGALLNEVWELSLAGTPTWTELTPSGTLPNTRAAHGAIYDPVRDRMVVFGGGYSTPSGSYVCRNDVWALSLAGTMAWTELTPSGTLPSARRNFSAIYDPVRDRMVVFGGFSDSYINYAWALSLAGTPAWAQLAVPWSAGPNRRDTHSAIYDATRDRMVVFGGHESVFFNDAYALWWSSSTAVDDPQAQPLISGLRPPAPNPTRGTTGVSYALAQAGRVQLSVYDVSGRLVRRLVDGERRAGVETVVWNGTDAPGARLGAGVYFVRLVVPGLRETRRVILLR